MKSFIVDNLNSGQRLNKYCGRVLVKAPQSFVYKMLRKKNITLNGKKADGSETLKAGDEIKFFLSDETFDKFAGEGIEQDTTATSNIPPLTKSEIIFEDDNILVVRKKAGELSQKVKPTDVSVNERIVAYLSQDKGQETVKFTPGICNRLDRNTEGLVIAGKNLRAQSVISKMLKERTLDKFYIATVMGRFDKKQDVTLYLTKDEATNTVKISREKSEGAVVTHSIFYPLHATDSFSIVKVKLETGKSHQIRAQLAFLGHPIVGDFKYGNSKVNEQIRAKYGIRSQMLLAHELRFPKDFTELEGLAGKSIRTTVAKSTIDFWEGENLCPHGTPEA